MTRSRNWFEAQHCRARALVGGCLVAVTAASARAFDFGGFSPPLSIASGGGPIELVAVDLDGDGDLDFAVANHWDHTIRVIKRHANGSFVPAGLYTTGNYPDSIAAGDFDADGDPDLAVVGQYNANVVFIHANNGNGHFQSATTFAVGGFPSSVASADVNGDGIADVIVANHLPSTLSVLISNGVPLGPGAFQAQAVFPLGGAPSQVVAADFNGDGTPDIGVACWGSHDVRILLNRGQGKFRDPTVVPADLMPYGVGTGDFDNDGRADLATANFSNGTVSVMMGRYARAQVAFAPADHVPVASYNLRAIAVDDFDRDGNADIVAAHGWLTVHTLIGNGDGTFQPPVGHAAGSEPRGIVSADVDGDGDRDLVVANFGNGMISVLTNLTPAP